MQQAHSCSPCCQVRHPDLGEKEEGGPNDIVVNVFPDGAKAVADIWQAEVGPELGAVLVAHVGPGSHEGLAGRSGGLVVGGLGQGEVVQNAVIHRVDELD